MSHPEYISPDMISAAEEDAQIEEAKKEDAWTTDSSDGSMYFFLDENQGWRLEVVDAAAGSRFYQLEHTTDGGINWETASTDPFQGNGGVAEGLIFYDGNFGVAGLSGASQTHSTLYLTRDGGLTFTAVQLPMATVTELPKTAQEYGLTLDEMCIRDRDNIMKQNLRLTRSEKEIMDKFWEKEEGFTCSEIVDASPDRSWRKSSAHLLINALLKKGFLEVSGFKKSAKNLSLIHI